MDNRPQTATVWLTTEGVMDYLGITSRTTLQSWIDHGLPVHNITARARRFDQAEVDEWVRSRCSDPGAGDAAA